VASTTAAATPKTIGRYVLFDEIAAGGMATVHLARLMGPIGFARTVAVKQMHPHLANDAESRAMFIDEARMASRVRHANAVSVLDVVVDERDLLLVMDYIHGESLARLVKARPEESRAFPVPVASAILIGVLHGLHAAHEAKDEKGQALGLVHRDVSPQNILVGLDGVPRVVDFGIAKAAGRLQSTTDGQLKGKAAYLAPEQILGGEIDRRVDVYSASVVLWELLTGRRLFDGDIPASTLRQVLSPTFEPPSSYVATVPGEVDRVVMQGLAWDPASRFATAWDMASALESVAPPASVREISEWVEAVAGETLRTRAKRVGDIESASPADVSSMIELRRREDSADHIATAIEGVSAPTPGSAETKASPFVRAKRLAAAGVGLGALSVGGWFVLGSHGARPHAETSPAAAVVAASTSPDPHPADVSPPPLPSAVAIAAAPSGSVLTAKAGARSSPPFVGKPKASRRAPTGNCAVPFTWAPDGTKVPKAECL
jgi:serine/threonine-protein kinase